MVHHTLWSSGVIITVISIILIIIGIVLYERTKSGTSPSWTVWLLLIAGGIGLIIGSISFGSSYWHNEHHYVNHHLAHHHHNPEIKTRHYGNVQTGPITSTESLTHYPESNHHLRNPHLTTYHHPEVHHNSNLCNPDKKINIIEEYIL